MTTDWIPDLLRLFAFDDTESLWWRDDDGVLSFFVRCNDTFWWATADLAQILESDLPTLRQAKADTAGMDHHWMWPILWVARQRETRPMRAFYKNVDEPLRTLLDAAGPERDPASEG